MDASLTAQEKRMYDVWMHSPTVSSSDPLETILAYKISKLIQLPASKTLKALRGLPGLDPEVTRRVEAFVAEDPSLRFEAGGEHRRIVLVESVS